MESVYVFVDDGSQSLSMVAGQHRHSLFFVDGGRVNLTVMDGGREMCHGHGGVQVRSWAWGHHLTTGCVYVVLLVVT